MVLSGSILELARYSGGAFGFTTNEATNLIYSLQNGDANKVANNIALSSVNEQFKQQLGKIYPSTSAKTKGAIDTALSCGTTQCMTEQYQVLTALQVGASGDDALAINQATERLKGQAQVMGACIPGANCAAALAGVALSANALYRALGKRRQLHHDQSYGTATGEITIGNQIGAGEYKTVYTVKATPPRS